MSKRSKDGELALHTVALPGHPYEGHNAPNTYEFRVTTQGQKLRVTHSLIKLMKRRAAVEPVIGHIKNEQCMDRNYLQVQMAMPATPSSPQQTTTSDFSSTGGGFFCT